MVFVLVQLQHQPPPPKSNNGNNNNYYIRRPTVVFNDERGGPSDKSSGAQARMNNKFVNFSPFFLFIVFLHWFSHRVFVQHLQLIIVVKVDLIQHQQ